jgi:hypothetical protein
MARVAKGPTRAERAVEAGERWPCPAGCTTDTATPCLLCKLSGPKTTWSCDHVEVAGWFDPAVILAARRRRIAREWAQFEVAAALGMPTQRFAEMEDGRDLAPDSWGGPERRKLVAEKFVMYLRLLARPMVDPNCDDV